MAVANGLESFSGFNPVNRILNVMEASHALIQDSDPSRYSAIGRRAVSLIHSTFGVSPLPRLVTAVSRHSQLRRILSTKYQPSTKVINPVRSGRAA